MPTIIFFAALLGALYYLGAMPFFSRLMRISGAEAFEEIPLFGPDGSFAGLTVPVRLHRLDTFFTTSRCVNF